MISSEKNPQLQNIRPRKPSIVFNGGKIFIKGCISIQMLHNNNLFPCQEINMTLKEFVVTTISREDAKVVFVIPLLTRNVSIDNKSVLL